MRLHRAVIALALALPASPALAEVSDKIPGPGWLWGSAIAFTLAALLLSLWRPAAGLAVVPLAALMAWGGYDMVTDPDLGPAIVQGQGEAYVRAVHASGALGVIGPLLAVALVLLWHRRKPPVDAPRRNEYRLSGKPAPFFTDALERALAQPPEIVMPGDPNGGRYGKRRTFLWDLAGPDGEELDYHLAVFSDVGAPEDAFPFARRVFADLVAMDDAARAIPGEADENEYLFSVTLDPECGAAELGYASTRCNTEWSVHFRAREDGTFACLGIPDWRTPGAFIT